MNTMRITTRRAAGPVASLLLALSASGAVHADIVECPPVQGSFTVFLSEPEYTPAAFQDRAQLLAFMRRLKNQLDDDQDRRWAGSPNPAVRFVACENRAPSQEGQDFVPTLIDSMYSRRVLLEIWGELEADPVDGGKKLSARMNYLLVPIKFAANRHEPAPANLQRLAYSDQNASPAPDFVQLIGRPLDIDAFVAAALGFKLLRERSHELAHRNLCHASAQLQKVEKRLPPGRSRTDIAALRTFALESAARAITEARGDPQYSKTGVLWLQNPQSPCAEEE